MSLCAVILFLCVLGVCDKGLAAVIETKQTVMAAVGEEALLNCQLMEHKDVLLITWQKVLPEGEKVLAASHKIYSQTVNAAFRDKVEFKYAGLQNSSIVIRRVTEEDEGCYHCVFNTYPDGALTATTCLQLYELHEPVLHVRESKSPEEAVVSCWATGRPAPTVTLTVPHYNSTSVTNTNATVTVTATAVLPRPHGNSRQVGCAVRVLSGPQIEVFTMIPEVTLSSADGPSSTFVWVTVAAYVCVAAVIIIWARMKPIITGCHTETLRRTGHHKKTTKDAEELQTLTGKKDDKQIKQQTPPEKDQTSDNAEPSSSTARRLPLVHVNNEVTQNNHQESRVSTETETETDQGLV